MWGDRWCVWVSQEWQVCQVSVGVLGDVCRAIEDQVAPYTENIMRILLRNLESNDVQRNIKPQILSAFGDVALAIGDRFEPCLAPCLHMLQSAQVLTYLFCCQVVSHHCVQPLRHALL
jgi:importin subunit beta-1